MRHSGCDGAPAGGAGSHHEAARLFGAADGSRQRIGAVRFKIYDADYLTSVAGLRDAMGDSDFDSAWAEDAANANDPPAAGAHWRRPNAASSNWSAKGGPTTTAPPLRANIRLTGINFRF
jgi:hypothetical protein